ncbi:MAG: hypothetical protein MJ202_02150 [Lentisphaeria bacterium]|nr:hypothetical protein [Lentisphaeria bacterium]
MHPADIGEMLGEMADKKRLLKKNYKGRWTTYTLNTSSEDDELPLFAFSRQQNQDKQGEVTDKQGEVTDKQGEVSLNVKKLLKVLIFIEHSTAELCIALKIKKAETIRTNYLQRAIALELVEPTQPDSPRSPTQKYRLTEKGRAYLEAMKNHE